MFKCLKPKNKSTNRDNNDGLVHFIEVSPSTVLVFCHWYFGDSKLFGVSCFVFRASVIDVIVLVPFQVTS